MIQPFDRSTVQPWPIAVRTAVRAGVSWKTALFKGIKETGKVKTTCKLRQGAKAEGRRYQHDNYRSTTKVREKRSRAEQRSATNKCLTRHMPTSGRKTRFLPQKRGKEKRRGGQRAGYASKPPVSMVRNSKTRIHRIEYIALVLLCTAELSIPAHPRASVHSSPVKRNRRAKERRTVPTRDTAHLR